MFFVLQLVARAQFRAQVPARPLIKLSVGQRCSLCHEYANHDDQEDRREEEEHDERHYFHIFRAAHLRAIAWLCALNRACRPTPPLQLRTGYWFHENVDFRMEPCVVRECIQLLFHLFGKCQGQDFLR